MGMLETLKVTWKCHSRLMMTNRWKNKIKYEKRVESLLKIKFDSEPVYGDNEKYIMTKIKIYGGHVNTTFQGKGMPKKVSYKCLSLIMKDCVVKSKKKYYPQKLLEECKYEAK